ncbi:MAG: uronate dehydrogenase [Actinomycetota bacterium]|nr:uronate dehydrogenase [Actinomycetota bacterium]
MSGVGFRRVLLTGAAGRIGSALRPGLRTEVEELRLTDRTTVGPAPGTTETFVQADLLDEAAVARSVEGVDAIVHLGGIPDEAPFDELLGPNIHGTFTLFDAARRAGVTRIVYASSNHASGFYGPADRLTGEEPPRPDSLYGVTKVFGEAVGRLYADKFGLQVIAVRIGSFEQEPSEPRHLHTWLSPGDALRLFRSCLTDKPVHFLTIYGVSANTQTWWPSGDAARTIGFEPQDDAERFAEKISNGATDTWQGGRFAARDYGRWAAD